MTNPKPLLGPCDSYQIEHFVAKRNRHALR